MTFGIIHLRDILGNPACNYRMDRATVTSNPDKVTCLRCQNTGLFTRRQMDLRR